MKAIIGQGEPPISGERLAAKRRSTRPVPTSPGESLQLKTIRSKVTSVIVTHLMDSAFRVATRMAMLHRGKMVTEGTAEQMRQSRNPFVVQFLSGSTEGPILDRSKYHILSPWD
ncbi:MAG: hypothetical protein ABI217_00595 [Chthoniobacterales bacterium]